MPTDRRLKAIVTAGSEERFIVFCRYKGVDFKQYPEPLQNRFSIAMRDEEIVKGFEELEGIELMPLVTIQDFDITPTPSI